MAKPKQDPGEHVWLCLVVGLAGMLAEQLLWFLLAVWLTRSRAEDAQNNSFRHIRVLFLDFFNDESFRRLGGNP